MVICLERGADLHMAQLVPLPLTVSCFSEIQIGFTFLVPAHLGSPGQRAVKRVCVCVCVCVQCRQLLRHACRTCNRRRCVVATIVIVALIRIATDYTSPSRRSIILLYSSHTYHQLYSIAPQCLQCFDAVGWAAGRASGL